MPTITPTIRTLVPQAILDAKGLRELGLPPAIWQGPWLLQPRPANRNVLSFCLVHMWLASCGCRSCQRSRRREGGALEYQVVVPRAFLLRDCS